MGKPEIKALAQKLAEIKKKKEDEIASLKAKYPELQRNTDTVLSRVSWSYMDISGTEEAEKKNVEFLKLLNTEEGRKKVFQRYLKDMFSVDVSKMYSDDPEVVLNDMMNNYTGYIVSADSQKMLQSIGSELNIQGKVNSFLMQNRNTYQHALSLITNINFYADKNYDIDVLNKLNPEDPDDLADLEKIVDKNDVGVVFAYCLDHQKNEKIAQKIEKLKSEGVDFSKLYLYYATEGENSKRLEIFDAVENDPESKYTVVKADKSEMQVIDTLFQEDISEEYDVHFEDNDKTSMPAYEGIKGIGYSSLPKKYFEERGEKAAFYGGLEVSSEIQKELKNQPVAEILRFEKNSDKTYSVHFKLPEFGFPKVSDENTKPFAIRRNLNKFAQICANACYDKTGSLDAANSFMFFEELADSFSDINRPGLDAEGKKEILNDMFDRLGCTADDPARNSIADFVLADEDNSLMINSIIMNIYDEMKNLAIYQNQKNKQPEEGSPEYQVLQENKASFERIIANYRKMSMMNPETEEEMFFAMNTDRDAMAKGAFLNAAGRYAAKKDPEKYPSGNAFNVVVKEKIKNKVYGEINPFTGLQHQHSTMEVSAIDGVVINGRKVVLSLESATSPQDLMMSCHNDRIGLGIFDSVEELESVNSDVLIHNKNHDSLGKVYDINSSELLHVESLVIDESELDTYKEAAERKTTSTTTWDVIAKKAAKIKALVKKDEPGYDDLFKAISAIEKKDGEFTYEDIETLKFASGECLYMYDPKGNQSRLQKADTRYMQKVGFIKEVFGFASFEFNKLIKDGIAKKSAYDVLDDASKGADLFVNKAANGEYPVSFCNMIYDKIQLCVKNSCYKNIDIIKFINKSEEEKVKYFDSPEMSNTLATMALLSDHYEEIIQDMERIGNVSNKTKDDLRFAGVLYKPLFESVKNFTNEKAHDSAALRKQSLRAALALENMEKIKKELGNNDVRYADMLGNPLTSEAAASMIVSGQSFMVRKPGSNLESYLVEPEGKLNRHYINPSAKELTDPNYDYKKVLRDISRKLDATDSLFLFTSKDTSETIRRVVRAMADPKVVLSAEDQRKAYSQLSKLCNDYAVSKDKEIEKNGKLSLRSKTRLELIDRLGSIANAMKDPAAYQQRIKGAAKIEKLTKDAVQMNK